MTWPARRRRTRPPSKPEAAGCGRPGTTAPPDALKRRAMHPMRQRTGDMAGRLITGKCAAAFLSRVSTGLIA